MEILSFHENVLSQHENFPKTMNFPEIKSIQTFAQNYCRENHENSSALLHKIRAEIFIILKQIFAVLNFTNFEY